VERATHVLPAALDVKGVLSDQRAAVLEWGGASDFCAGFLDGSDRPITGLTVNLLAGISGRRPAGGSSLSKRQHNDAVTRNRAGERRFHA
jgi:hypothetical protein